MSVVDFSAMERRWQERWERSRIFEADPDERRKVFVTFPFPYMNGPLHVGHCFTASRVDAYARFKRMQGFNVLFPWAWHCSGATIAGASERIKKGDRGLIRSLIEIDKVPEKEVERFVDPYYMADYYIRDGKEVVKRIGFSVDWRREFDTVRPDFKRFISWQYETLRRHGYVVKGTHAVVWCPRCESATGSHDRLKGEGVTTEEYVLMKFQIGAEYLPAGTFRPETIFGVTNLWINPDVDYVKAEVDGELWIVSLQASRKLRQLGRDVTIVRSFKGSELIGRVCRSPVTNVELPILPATFVDPNCATGVVYSVPAHAPFDWLALRDLWNRPDYLRSFGIDPKSVADIRPISMIRVEGFGDFPALEIVDEMKIKDQHDVKAEDATRVVYRREFSRGVLKPICGRYAGKMVRDVKEEIIKDFVSRNVASSMYDLTGKVVCRCGTECGVKVLQDQWFLNFSDEKWKERAFDALDKMKIYPEEAREWFRTTFLWLKDKACVRSVGLGTPLPWQPNLVIETLADSTIYMSYYLIAKFVNSGLVKFDQLTPELFDYAFLGLGSLKKVSEATGVDRGLLQEMRREFAYWYPVDLRASAKELLPNHLTFSIFHHTAIFPESDWPRAFSVNGMVNIEGQKMSKSKGNFVPIKDAIERFGSDATRCALLLSAEDMNDPNWRTKDVQSMMVNLGRFYELARRIISMRREREEEGWVDKWLDSAVQRHIDKVTQSLGSFKTRTALENAFYEVFSDVRRYMEVKRDGHPRRLKKALDVWTRLMAPFAPHISEEIWHQMGNDGFVALAEWPVPDETRVDLRSELLMDMVNDLIEDTRNIVKALKTTPKLAVYYTASKMKWTIYLKALELAERGSLSLNNLMAWLKTIDDLKPHLGEASKYAQRIVRKLRGIPHDQLVRIAKGGQIDEFEALKEVSSYLERRLDVKVAIYHENDTSRYDPMGRASFAEPHRPAIYLE